MRDDIAPIHHSTGSAIATTAGSAVGGGFRTGAKAALTWILAFAILGVLVGTGAYLPIWEAVTAFGASIGTSLGLGGTGSAILGKGLFFGLAFGTFGLLTSGLPAVIGGFWGAGKGIGDGMDKVRQETALARNIETSIAIQQAQMMGEPSRYAGLPQPGSRFNPAMSSIQAASAESQGKIDQLALQRA